MRTFTISEREAVQRKGSVCRECKITPMYVLPAHSTQIVRIVCYLVLDEFRGQNPAIPRKHNNGSSSSSSSSSSNSRALHDYVRVAATSIFRLSIAEDHD